MDLHCRTPEARFHIALSSRGRPTRNLLTYVGTEGSAYVNLYHGFVLFESGSVSRWTKAAQPLRFGARLALRSASNLSGRLVNSVWAYPGLRDLLQEFYGAAKGGGAPPVEHAEIVAIARSLDRLRVSAGSGR
jgi:hypothetical protein